MTHRRTLSVAALAALVIGSALLGGPRATAPLASSNGPEGTLALRRLLAGMGSDVADGDLPPSTSDTFVLLIDLRLPEEAEPILEWVARGGRLVLADPGSVLTEALGVGEIASIGGLTAASLRPACASREAADVQRIAVQPGDAVLDAPGPRAVACFPRGDGAFQVTVRHGDGEAVLLGGVSPLTNELLRRQDNAAYSLRTLGARGRIVFGAAIPPGAPAGRTGGVWGALPTPARIIVIQVLVALLLFALVRGRRLGRPVLEEPIVPIPASELMRATGRLYRAARAGDFAGHLLRRRALDRVARRLGLGPHADAESAIRRLTAGRGEREEGLREALIGASPRNDEQLIALSRELDDIVRRVEEER